MISKSILGLLFAATRFATVRAAESPPQVDADHLAKQLSNRVASLVSLPIQVNFDFGIGGRFHLDKPDGGPDSGLLFIVTLLFPK